MKLKLSAVPRSTLRGVVWLAVLGVILTISAYSLYYVARHLGVPKIFAAGMSTAYDGTALIAADKSLQYAQEGRSGAAPRMVMIIFAGLSAWLNSLHAILGQENPLVIPMWAGLPIAAATVFELHTSQARAKALARLGKKYPSPLPSWGGVTWFLFPLMTMDKLRDYVCNRAFGLSRAQVAFLREENKDHRRRGIHTPETINASTSGTATAGPRAATPARKSATVPASGNATSGVPGSASGGSATGRPAGSSMAGPAVSVEADSGPGTAPDGGAPESATDDTATVTTTDTSGVIRPDATVWSDPATGNATRECAHCHEPFVPIRRTKRYCGSNCRTAATRARQAAAEEAAS